MSGHVYVKSYPNPVPNENQGPEFIFWPVFTSALAYYRLLHIYSKSWILVHYPRICNICADAIASQVRTRVMF